MSSGRKGKGYTSTGMEVPACSSNGPSESHPKHQGSNHCFFFCIAAVPQLKNVIVGQKKEGKKKTGGEGEKRGLKWKKGEKRRNGEKRRKRKKGGKGKKEWKGKKKKRKRKKD